jgi:hypothetical protein
MIKRLFSLLFVIGILFSVPAKAQDDVWTDVGAYLFLPSIGGDDTDAQSGNVSVDVEVTASDILDALDFGYMGFLEHRNGRWSFIADGAYVAMSESGQLADNRVLSVRVSGDIEQLILEGFAGYRFYQHKHGPSTFGLDLLGGLRYNSIELEFGSQIALLGLTRNRQRNFELDWVDGVGGIRAQYQHNTGWGVSGWADYGKGDDSSSYQLGGFVGYQFENNVRVFGGYRHYHFEYDEGAGTNRFAVELNYSGPLFGAAYRF